MSFDQALADRLFERSPLVNDDIRRTLADTYVIVLLQINMLRGKMLDGTLAIDEARTIPTLVNHLRKLAYDLKLVASKEELGLSLDPLAVRSSELDEAAE